MISLVVKSSRASLSRVFNNGQIIEPSRPICSLALSIKSITTICCFLILITNAIASPMEIVEHVGTSKIRKIGEKAVKVKTEPTVIPTVEEISELTDEDAQSRGKEALDLVNHVLTEKYGSASVKIEPKFKEEPDFLLAMLPFRHSGTDILSPEMWEAIYIPPILKLPKHGRYPSHIPYFNLKQGEREYLYDSIIKSQLELKFEKIYVDRFRKVIEKAIRDTVHRYHISSPDTWLGHQFWDIIHSWSARSALDIFQDIEVLFREDGVSMELRKDLWTFMLYHAFLSSSVEKHLISLYRTNEFRQVLIGYMTDLYKFDQKLHGFAWPLHEQVFEEAQEETSLATSGYGRFFMYHDYLLKVNKNELMELLDRDVLISQLIKKALHPDLLLGLLALPQNWRYQNGRAVRDLVEKSQLMVRSLLLRKSGKEKMLSPEGEAEKNRELQAALNILLHLRAYGDQLVKDKIKELDLIPGSKIAHTLELEKNVISSSEAVDRWSARRVSQYLQEMWRRLGNFRLFGPGRRGFVRLRSRLSRSRGMTDSPSGLASQSSHLDISEDQSVGL